MIRGRRDGIFSLETLLRAILWTLPFTVASTSLLSIGSLGDSIFLGRLMVVGLAVLALRLALIEPFARGARPWLPEQIALLAFIGALTVWGAASLFWMRDPVIGAKSVINIMFALILASSLIVVLRHRPARMPDFLAGWVVAVLLIVGLGLFEVFSGIRLPTQRDETVAAVLESTPAWTGSVFPNPNDMAAFMVVALPALLFLQRISGGIRRWFVLVTIVVALVGTLLAAARIASLTMVLAIFLYAITRDDATFRTKLATMGGLIGGILLLTTAFPLYLEKMTRLGDAVSVEHENSRAQLAVDGVWVTLQTGGFGVGPGNFREFADEPHLPFQNLANFTPHNIYVEVLAEYGLLLGVALVGGLLWLTVRWIGNRHLWPPTRAVLLAGLLCMFLVGLESSRALTLNTLLLPTTLMVIAGYRYGDALRQSVKRTAEGHEAVISENPRSDNRQGAPL